MVLERVMGAVTSTFGSGSSEKQIKGISQLGISQKDLFNALLKELNKVFVKDPSSFRRYGYGQSLQYVVYLDVGKSKYRVEVRNKDGEYSLTIGKTMGEVIQAFQAEIYDATLEKLHNDLETYVKQKISESESGQRNSELTELRDGLGLEKKLALAP